MDKVERVKGFMRTIADDTESEESRRQAAYDLWNASNSVEGARAILNQGYPGEILNIYDTLEFDGAKGLKGRLVGVLCCLTANLPLADAENLFQYDVQSRLFDLRCSTDAVKQPINALCGLCNILHHHGNHRFMHGDVQLFNLAKEAHASCVERKAFHNAYYSRWGLVRCLAYMAKLEENLQPMIESGIIDEVCKYAIDSYLASQRVEEYVLKFVAALALWAPLDSSAYSTNLLKVVEHQIRGCKSVEAKKHAVLALFNHYHLKMESKQYLKPHPAPKTEHILILTGEKDTPPELNFPEEATSKVITKYPTTEAEMDATEELVRNSSVVLVVASMDTQLCLITRCLARYAAQLEKPLVFLQTDGFYEPRDWILTCSRESPFFRELKGAEGEEAAIKKFGQLQFEASNIATVRDKVLEVQLRTSTSKDDGPTTGRGDSHSTASESMKLGPSSSTLDRIPDGERQEITADTDDEGDADDGTVKVGGPVQAAIDALLAGMKVQASLGFEQQKGKLRALRAQLRDIEDAFSETEGLFMRQMQGDGCTTTAASTTATTD